MWRNRSEPAVTNTWTFWFTPLSCCSTYPVTPLHSRVITAAFCGRFRHMTEGKRDWRGVRFFLIDGPIFAFHDSQVKGKKNNPPDVEDDPGLHSLGFSHRCCSVIHCALAALDGLLIAMKIGIDEQLGRKKMIVLIFRKLILG